MFYFFEGDWVKVCVLIECLIVVVWIGNVVFLFFFVVIFFVWVLV